MRPGAALAALLIAGCAGAPDSPAVAEPPAAARDGEAPVAQDVALQRFEFKQIVMAIEARIVLYAPDEATAKAAASAAFAELDRLDAVFSDYREDSELMQLCRATYQGERVQLSTDLACALAMGVKVFEESNGAFDPSVGSLTHLWRSSLRSGRLPSRDEIADARERCGWERVATIESLPVAQHFVRFLRDGVQLDLGGVAKGYSLGVAFDTIRAKGLDSVLIEMGGDLIAGKPPPGEAGWSVHVGPAGPAGQMLVVSSALVSTSGDSSQGVTIDGTTYSHVIDPRTGWPLTSRLGCTLQDFAGYEPFGGAGGEPGPWSSMAAAITDAQVTTCTILGTHDGRRFAGGESRSRKLILFHDPAFTTLFDGTSLTGWTPRGGHYDGDAVWTVEDHCLTGHTGVNDAGGLLYTATPHTSFEFQCEVQLDYPFDSGIFVRMAPEGRGLQLTLDDRPDGEVGGLYSDGWIEHARPEAATAWRRGAWNHVFVRCTGFDMRLEAWINGVLMMDRVVPQEFAADGKPAFAPRGLIGLQVHGGGSEGTGNAVRFRDLQVRDLPVFGDSWATDRGLSPPEREARAAARASDGWRDLLAGSDALAAWEAIDGEAAPHAPTDYSVHDGQLSIPATPPAGYLRTRENFRDFDLRFDFRQARMSNSGLFLRGRRESTGPDGGPVSGGNPAYSGCEIQLLDDWNWETVTNSHLEPWQFTGSLYGAVPPVPGLLAPIGKWNTLEVLARGSRLACALNGQTLWDVDTAHVQADPPFAQRAAGGFIGLQRYAAPNVEGAEALGVRDMYLRSR